MLGALREGARAEDQQEALFEDRPALVMRAGHPLLTATDPAKAMFAYPWLLPGAETPLRRYWQDMVRTLGRDVPHVQVECGSVMMHGELLLGSDALTLLSPGQVSVELDAGVLAAMPTPCARRPDDRHHHPLRLAAPTAAQADFLALLRAVGREQAQG